MPILLFARGDAAVAITYFDDQNRTYDIESVLAQEDQLFTKQLQSDNAKFPPNATVWLKVTLVNAGDTRVEKVVEFLDIRLDRMDIYSQEGELLNALGDIVPFDNRVYDDAKIAINVGADAHQQNSILIRCSNADKSDLTYRVNDKEAYINNLVFEKIMHAFFFGALLIMLVYNFVLYLFIRENAFLIYIVYHIVVLVVMLYYNGLVSQYYYPDSFDINGGNVPVELGYLSVIFAIAFLRNFLNTREHTPKIDRWLHFFIYLNVTLLVLAFFKMVHNSLASVNMMSLSLFVLYVSGYHAFVLKRKLALFYLFGWLVMLLGIILTGLLSLGIIERNDFTSYIFQIGIVIEIALLSMGLAYRYKINQDQLAEKTRVLHEQSKLASMGEMLRHIAHQWRQPLSEINSVAMKIETEHRRKTLDDDSLDKNIEQIENLTEHMSKTIQDFNGYFKSNKEKVDRGLEEVVDKALDLVWSGLKKSDIRVDKSIESVEKVNIVEGELIQVLLVLLNNARDALDNSDVQEKWIKIRIAKEENGRHIIEVEDSAGGIETENLTKVFEPYFTTKFESQGVGIGLYMSKMIVEESLGGTLHVSNSTKGAKFTLRF